MARKIEGYFDCVSPYSYFAITFLMKHKDVLAKQGVEIDFHPMFLSGVMQATGNQPPGKLPARGAYNQLDITRAMKYFDRPNFKMLKRFPINTLVLERCLTLVKAENSKETFEATLKECLVAVWEKAEDVENKDIVADVLGRIFSEAESRKIIETAAQEPWKSKLTATTKDALDKGAYGAPWFWVTNVDGKEEPFFGSDRFHYMWKFLDLNYEDLKLLDDTSRL